MMEISGVNKGWIVAVGMMALACCTSLTTVHAFAFAFGGVAPRSVGLNTRTDSTGSVCPSRVVSSKNKPLWNVPPPSETDVEAVKAGADREAPPASFFELQINCARATRLAMADGYKLLEVEVGVIIFSYC
jgi:hypothetical protein